MEWKGGGLEREREREGERYVVTGVVMSESCLFLGEAGRQSGE